MECRPNLFNICVELKITQYHNVPKNELINAIIERQNKLDELKGSEEVKEDSIGNVEGFEEAKGQDEPETNMELIVCDDSEYSETLNLTKELKTQFLEKHYFFEFNKQVWTQAKKVTEFLEFVDSHKVIQQHVLSCNKITFKSFPKNIQSLITVGMPSGHTQHIKPDTIFINDESVFVLECKR